MDTILDRVRATQSSIQAAVPTRANIEATRYVWHPVMDISHPDVMAINGGEKMQRLKWQPITRAPRWEPILSRLDGGWVATRPPAPQKAREGMYWIMPARIADSMGSMYAETGLIDSKILVGVDLDTFGRLHLDEIFFPESGDDLPNTFETCKARIKTQLAQLKAGSPKSPDGAIIPLAQELIAHVIEIGEEMLEGLVRAANYLKHHLDERHAEMEKAKTDTSGRYRGTYDRREYLILAWLEIAPRDQAINKLAMDSNNMPKMIAEAVQASMGATADMVKASQINTEALGAAIGKSLAESLGPLIKGNNAPAAQPQPGQNPNKK